MSDEMAQQLKQIPALKAKDVADAIMYALSTPPHVQIHELLLLPVGAAH